MTYVCTILQDPRGNVDSSWEVRWCNCFLVCILDPPLQILYNFLQQEITFTSLRLFHLQGFRCMVSWSWHFSSTCGLQKHRLKKQQTHLVNRRNRIKAIVSVTRNFGYRWCRELGMFIEVCWGLTCRSTRQTLIERFRNWEQDFGIWPFTIGKIAHNWVRRNSSTSSSSCPANLLSFRLTPLGPR